MHTEKYSLIFKPKVKGKMKAIRKKLFIIRRWTKVIKQFWTKKTSDQVALLNEFTKYL